MVLPLCAANSRNRNGSSSGRSGLKMTLPRGVAIVRKSPLMIFQYHVAVEMAACLRHDRTRTNSTGRGGRMADLLQIEDFKPHVGKIFRFKGTRFAIPLARI